MKTSFALSFFAGLLIAMAPLAAATPKAQTIIVIKDTKKMEPKDLSAITEALKTNSTIQAYIDQGQWTVDIGVAAPGNVLPEVIPLLLDLTAAQPNNIEFNKAAEDYAFYYARTFQGGKPSGEARNLIRQTVANLVGISPALLQRWPDFEQFLVANGIERQLKDLGDKITVGRYGIPTLNVNGKPYSWTIFKQRFPIDEKTGKLTGFTYTKKGIQPNRELEAEFEALVNAARTEAEKSAGDQSQRIAKLQTWINTIQKQLNTKGLPSQYVNALEVELNGSQPNGVQVELQEIEKNQKNYPELQPQLGMVHDALLNAQQHAKYLLMINEPIRQIQADIKQYGNQNSYIIGRITQLQKDLTNFETKNANLPDSIRSDIQQRRNELNALNPNQDPGSALQDIHKQIRQIQADIKQYGNQNSYIVGRITQLQKDLTNFETKYANLPDSIRSDIQQLRNELNALNPNQQQRPPQT